MREGRQWGQMGADYDRDISSPTQMLWCLCWNRSPSGGGHGAHISANYVFQYFQPCLAGVPAPNVLFFGSCRADMSTDVMIKQE